ncbi:1-acyl-sn-glycerol-3-phosphate acyltransferase [Thermoleophilia bacterium SCSIO 60948]|nr:1-acyl-sn-glycerol-3-phosphate acyltransferase [Thermoleophilia bacterium SCSIO 60948]
MSDSRDAGAFTGAYKLAIGACRPAIAGWGRMKVEGLDALPPTGPVLLAGNHDSYWDTVSIGLAAKPVRQVRALAKAELWKVPGLGGLLDGMGQIPINRGKGDTDALENAVRELRAGACIGIFPEGTRSKGAELRPRSGIGRLAQRVPEAEIVCVAVVGTTDFTRFPKRPEVTVRFFRPAEGNLRPDEDPKDFAARLVREIRAEAPWAALGRKASA